ncbi:MAG: hypothetical protein ACM3N4_02625 [Nitrososphaerota archaeon]
MRGRRVLISALVTLLLLVGSTSVVVLARNLQNAARWTGMTIRNVSMVSSDEGWAVGVITGSSHTLLLHYRAGHWTAVTPPADLNPMADLAAVAMVSRDEGWAVGQVPVPTASRTAWRPSPLVLHYHGGKWTIAATPQREYLSGVAARSASDVWAVGYSLVLHYDGVRWTEVPVPRGLSAYLFTTVSLPDDGSVWIAGGSFILRYDGHAWQQQELPPAEAGNGFNITDLAMQSATAGWAVGTIYNSPRGVILHNVSGRWVVDQETEGGLTAITMLDGSEGWAVGGSIIMHYSRGRWTDQSDGAHYLLDVAMATSSDVWAVGPDQVLHFHGGSWQSNDDLQWEQGALQHFQGK